MSYPRPMPVTPKPTYRQLWVFAIDPALAAEVETFDVACTTIDVRWDDLIGPGPVGRYIEVIDYDPLSGCYYPPVNLEEREILANSGLSATESDPRFHQQMVYAVIMNTVQTFENALGRRVLWAQRKLGYGTLNEKGKPRKATRYKHVDKLRVYPHALRDANAYYDPERVALLFGYFPARSHDSARSEGLVFTALSFDVITHETTHAILDGMHRRFTESTNPDVLAFHEGLADIVALLQHFSLPDLLRHQISVTRGQLESDNMLAQLAVQFGRAIGQYGALRDAIGEWKEELKDPSSPNSEKVRRWKRATPDERVLRATDEPHARGAILVSAVFDAFLKIYNTRTADLLRIATKGSGILDPGALHPDLVNRLAQEASKIARQVLRMCIRALDYVPPIDITFGEYLRAILTSDSDVAPVDAYHYRIAFIQSFRKWGIFPDNTRTLGELDLRWQALGGKVDPVWLAGKLGGWFDSFKSTMRKQAEEYSDLTDVHEIQRWTDDTSKMVHSLVMELTFTALGREAANIVLGLDIEKSNLFERNAANRLEVHSVRPCFKQQIDGLGTSRIEFIIELTQWCWVDYETLEMVPVRGEKPDTAFLFRGGATIVYDIGKGEFRYIIHKRLQSKSRRKNQRDFQAGLLKGNYVDATAQPFRLLHQGGSS